MLRTSSILASAVAVSLIGPACSDQVPDEDNEDGFVIEDGKADDFLSNKAKEYIVSGTGRVTV